MTAKSEVDTVVLRCVTDKYQPVRELGLMVDPDIYDDLLDCNHFTMILGFCVIDKCSSFERLQLRIFRAADSRREVLSQIQTRRKHTAKESDWRSLPARLSPLPRNQGNGRGGRRELDFVPASQAEEILSTNKLGRQFAECCAD